MNQPRALARPLCWGFCFQPMSIMSLPSLQKLLLMLLLQFTADQRKEFFTLLSFCWSKTIRITDGFPARCSLAGRQFGVYKRFNENLAPDQLLANALGLSTRTQANQDPKKKSLMTCSRRTRRWKVLPEEQNPNEQTESRSHWAWAHDHWGYWKLSLHSGSVPRSLLFALEGSNIFLLTRNTAGELGGGSDIQVCVENHLILTLMSAAPFFVELWLCCSALAESSFAGLSAWLVSSLMTWAVH